MFVCRTVLEDTQETGYLRKRMGGRVKFVVYPSHLLNFVICTCITNTKKKNVMQKIIKI